MSSMFLTYNPLIRLSRRYMLAALLVLVYGGATPETGEAQPTNPIALENAQTGNPASEWDVPNNGDPHIQGFTTSISVIPGEIIKFKVKSDAAFELRMYRMGYYAGLGARHTTTLPGGNAPPYAAHPQSLCPIQEGTGLVDCGHWSENAQWLVPSTAVSGIYFAKAIQPSTGSASHIVFIVRSDQSQSDIVFQTSDTTWQAYNYYGNRSLYTTPRAYKVSYNRPILTTTRGTNDHDRSWVFNAEYPLVMYLESNGFDVSYVSGVDVARSPSLLLNHKIFVSAGHDEYWSGEQRANVETARNVGVNLAFVSGNEMYWKTRWEPNSEYRTLVCFKETQANAKIDTYDQSVWTGTWRDTRFGPHDGGRPENAVTGTSFSVNGSNASAIEVPASFRNLRFWRNTGIDVVPAGQVAKFAPRSLGWEWDEDVDNGARPAGLMKLSETLSPHEGAVLTLGFNPETNVVEYYYPARAATHNMTLYKHASGALVFGAGNITLSWSLGEHLWDYQTSGGYPVPSPDAKMQQAVLNLFADMGAQAATRAPNLQPASASTDFVNPTSAIESFIHGPTFRVNTAVTIRGTASDVGGIVAAVEVSCGVTDSWHPAIGRETWTYEWTPQSSEDDQECKSRAIDDSGNIEISGTDVPFEVLAAAGQDMAKFETEDTNTRGNWKREYGADGYDIVGLLQHTPAYVTFSPEGSTHTWSSTSLDIDALQKDPAASDRILSARYGTDFTVYITFNDGQEHRVAFYFADPEKVRTQRVEVLDRDQVFLGSRELRDFGVDGVGVGKSKYLVWTVKGHARFTFKSTRAGSNAIVNGVFFGPGASTGDSGSAFLAAPEDSVTKGNWRQSYGKDGYWIPIEGGKALPAYASPNQVTVSGTVYPGGAIYSWPAAPPRDSFLANPNCCGQVAVATGWWDPQGLKVEFDFVDNNPHVVALYFWDYDGDNRSQKITVTDGLPGGLGQLLVEPMDVASFNGGKYLVWSLKGHVVITITNNNPPESSNAVLHGIFFGPPSGRASYVRTDIVTHGTWQPSDVLAYGTEGYHLQDDSAPYPGYVGLRPAVSNAVAAHNWLASVPPEDWPANKEGFLQSAAIRVGGVPKRIFQGWYDATSFTADIDLTDGAIHRVAFYCADWDGGRKQTVEVRDLLGSLLAEPITIEDFTLGQYVVWDLRGHVRVVFRNAHPTGASNAVLSAIFFDHPQP
jgi:N,N-dimethylformamidase beta subunit-like protein